MRSLIGTSVRKRVAAGITAASLATSALTETAPRTGGPLSVQTTIGELLAHPAFAGHAERLLPWAGRSYAQDMSLDEIAALLPYHSHVDPPEVVDSLNRMIADVARGQQVFFDIYSDAERQTKPDLDATGVFFFRGRPGAPFAVIAPGGGFSYVGSVHEGFPFAQAISQQGYNAFVLTYRTGQGGEVATRDLARATSFIFGRAADLGVGTQDYSLWGSSAGARMAASIGSHGVRAFGGEDLPRPAAVVMLYTAHSDRSDDEPPTFVAVGEQDGISPPARMERRVDALRAQGTLVEYHRFANLAHGFGLGSGTSAEGWIGDAVSFWEQTMQFPPSGGDHIGLAGKTPP